LIDVDFLDREEALYSAVEKRKFLFKRLLEKRQHYSDDESDIIKFYQSYLFVFVFGTRHTELNCFLLIFDLYQRQSEPKRPNGQKRPNRVKRTIRDFVKETMFIDDKPGVQRSPQT
jgi:hypothetical protein